MLPGHSHCPVMYSQLSADETYGLKITRQVCSSSDSYPVEGTPINIQQYGIMARQIYYCKHHYFNIYLGMLYLYILCCLETHRSHNIHIRNARRTSFTLKSFTQSHVLTHKYTDSHLFMTDIEILNEINGPRHRITDRYIPYINKHSRGGKYQRPQTQIFEC